jgi:type III restriction enzyme
MYPRLFLASQLLRDDGVIFISIDDNEVHNLRMVMNDIFGEENFIGTIIWQKVYAPKNTARHFSEDHDYIIVYARNSETWRPTLLPRTEEADARYSATHRNPYNVVYRLTPFEAYRQGHVKRIEVASVVKEDDANLVYLRLDRIDTKKNTITARIALHKLMANGTVKESVVTVKPGDKLEGKSGRIEYRGFDIEEINPGAGFIRFSNRIEMNIGESQGADKEAIFEAQIKYTIEEHFRKQRRLKKFDIKVLTLFFIDRVNNYAERDGIIRRVFYKMFNELKSGYPEWKNIDPETVQAAYFAKKKKKGGDVELLDSISGKTRADEEAYDLIMKDKERLLSFDEPVSFIFSHSALREGWDNPNIFQICTLNQTASEIKKRQEIGRGVRLAVDQSGERTREEKINVLTVVANESYERYVERLQSEIEEEFGLDGMPPKPGNARKRKTAKLKKHYTLKPEFKELWERIKYKTRYAVKLDTEKLLNDVMPDIDAEEIRPPRVTVSKAVVKVGDDDNFVPMAAGKGDAIDLSGRYPLPNLVSVMSHLMENTTPPVRLTRKTLLEIFKRTKNQKAAMDNPQEFASVAVRIIKDKLADHLVNGIQYEKINEWYEMAQLDAEIDSWEEYMLPATRSVYDNVICESGPERKFVEDLDNRTDVKLYLKLPGWFTVPTPVGEYNPDWAIVMEDLDAHGDPKGEKLLYLVRETKGNNWKTELRPDERRKITCGKRHFDGALGVNYRVVSRASELP